MSTNQQSKTVQDFKLEATERLESMAEKLQECLCELEAVCDRLEQDSLLYQLLLGQFKPKIADLITNYDGYISISDLIFMLSDEDLRDMPQQTAGHGAKQE